MCKIFIFYCALFISSMPMQAIIYGSDNEVNVFGDNLFFSFRDLDNEIRGFSYLQEGLTLENQGCLCSYNAFCPIFKTIDLRGGTLTLDQDVVMGINSTVQTGGIVDANFHAMHFSTTSTVFLPLISKQESGSCLEFIVEDTYGDNPRVVSVDWSPDDRYLAAVRETRGAVGQFYIYDFDAVNETLTNIVTLAGALDIVVHDMRWHPTKNYIALCGDDRQTNNNIGVFDFDSTTSQVQLVAGADSGEDIYECAWHPSGNYILTYQDGNPEIVIYTFNDPPTPPFPETLTVLDSYDISAATKRCSNWHAADWSETGSFFAVGCDSNNVLPELYVFSFDPVGTPHITLKQSAQVLTGGASRTVRSLDWSATTTTDYIIISTSGSGPEDIRVWEYDQVANTLTERLVYVLSSDKQIETVQWSFQGNYFIIGRQYDKKAPSAEWAIGYFDAENYTFSFQCEQEVSQSVVSARWSHNDIYLGRGSDRQSIYPTTGVYFGNSFDWRPDIIFRNIKLSFDSDVRFNGPIKFQGVNRFNGNNHILDFTSTGSVLIDSGATLLLENLKVKFTADGLIKFLDTDSTLALRNVMLCLDDTFSFTQGSIQIVGDAVITGTHLFNFESGQQSTINEYATLFFDSGVTFSYASTAGRDLLAFADKTAILHLFETPIYSVVPGMQLKKGTVVVEGTCPVINNATTKDEGVLLGDGVSSENDVDVKILPESGFDVRFGYLTSQLVGSP